MTFFGVLTVNKPAGRTSRDVVDRVERLVRPARAGHAGTLDPLATGVLVICVGQATRLIQYIQQMPKTYRARFLLGQTSDTDDIEGQITRVEGAAEPAQETLNRVLARFVGEIEQRPPAHSAIKLAGQRAYQLARRGVTVELKPRVVAIHRIDVRRYIYPELDVDVDCGSGTYIRALGRDIGAALGTGAVMSALERTAIGSFRADNSVQLETLTTDSLPQQLQPALSAVANLPCVTLSPAQFLEIRHGRPILKSWLRDRNALQTGDADLAAIDAAGRLTAILYEKLPGELWPRTYFTESAPR